jgi:hypothetical protein
MKRKAFLIGSPMIKGSENYLEGVTPDIQNMKSHLCSLEGGAWYDDEIKIFENPTSHDLKLGMSGSYDYIILQYSGHGFEYREDGAYFDINPTENISLNTLHGWIISSKRFYFFDSCRQIQKRIRESIKSMSMDSYNFSKQPLIEQYRKKYEDLIGSCEKGTSIIHSCSLHESASEDPMNKGGAFSYSYFQSSKDLNCASDKYYSIKTIFNKAVEYFNNNYPLFSSQHPAMWPERRNMYFPFVV